MKYPELTAIIKQSDNIVIFGGAGLSTESGIPDFRGKQGIYQNAQADGPSPEERLHHDYFMRHPKAFFEYYHAHLIHPDAHPNAAHYAFAKLEQIGKVSAVITQNIDGLHQLAGSQNVIELHGSILRNYCMQCKKPYCLEEMSQQDGIPICDECGGIVRPDVVLYGEMLDERAWARAEQAIRKADVLIVGGTSLTVQPAASLVLDYQGDRLVIVNQTRTPYDCIADLVIRDPIGEVFAQVMDDLGY